MRTTTHALWLTLCVACGHAEDARPAPLPQPPRPSTPIATSDVRTLRPPTRPFGDPIAFVDLMDARGAERVLAAWRYVDASIEEIDSNDPGPTLRPDGPPVRSHDVRPRPRADGWDEASWAPIDPDALAARRGHGHFALGWFRTTITLPERVDGVELRGATIVLEVVADDYSEVWVDGRLSASPGDDGGGPVSGFNTPNRVVLTRGAEPGHAYDVAFLAMNAPLSVSPPNFLWVRSVVLDVYAPAARVEVERLVDGLVEIGGIAMLEGAVLVCDVGANTIYRYDPSDSHLGVWRSHSGAADGAARPDVGAVGVAVDGDERVYVSERGRGRIVRIERTAATTVLAAVESVGAIAVDASGAVWALADGEVLRVTEEATTHVPDVRGVVAIGSDGTALYLVEPTRVVRRPIESEGTLGTSTVVYEAAAGDGDLRAIAVDASGAMYVARGSELVVVEGGRVTRTIDVGEAVRSVAIGEEDVFVATRTGLYRARR